MPAELMPWFIAWALLTTAVIALALWRNMLGLHDMEGLYISDAEKENAEEEARITRKIARIELWGKTLTVLSALLIVGIFASWLHTQLSGS